MAIDPKQVSTIATSSQRRATVFDIDLTAEANNTMADGSETIGGLTWTVENATNATLFDILNGTGLRITPSNTPDTDFNGATRTAPLGKIPLSTNIANFDPRARLILWLYWTSTGYTDPYHSTGLFAETDTTNDWLWMAKRVFDASSRWQMCSTVTQTPNNVNIDTLLAHDVMRLELPDGVLSTTAIMSTGTYSGGFPVDSAMITRAVRYNVQVATSFLPEASNFSGSDPTTFHVGFMSGVVDSGVAHTDTFKRVKLEYAP